MLAVDADVVREATGFPIGGVPPFGHSSALPVFVDPDLLQYDVVWAAAGTWNDVFSLSPTDLVRAERRRGHRPPPRLITPGSGLQSAFASRFPGAGRRKS